MSYRVEGFTKIYTYEYNVGLCIGQEQVSDFIK